MYKFSVAIPTYNSSTYLEECIYGFKNSNFLDEIIVGDDCSEINEIKKIQKIIHQAKKNLPFDIKLLKNEQNIGAYKNKYKLIEASKNDWVYQIDSDNVPFPKIDDVFSELISNHQSQMNIYYPSKIIQFWKYKRIAKFFSVVQKKFIVRFSKDLKIFNTHITQMAINEFLNYDSTGEVEGSPELKSKYVLDKHIYWVLNSGNFFVNKNQFVKIMKPGLDFPRENLSLDAIAFSYLWLKNGGSIVLHPKLSHYHRKRLNSVSYTEKEATKISREFFTQKILDLSNTK